MSEDYEYEVEDLAKFYCYLSQIGGDAVEQKGSELLEALRAVALLLPSRLPPNMNMMDLTLIGMPSSVREEFETMRKADRRDSGSDRRSQRRCS